MTRTRTKRPMRLIRRYFKTYGRYPRFRRGDLFVEACEGYIVINRGIHPTYIPKATLVELIRWVAPLIKEMGPSFDPDAAMSVYLAAELEHENEVRRMKGEARRKKRRGT